MSTTFEECQRSVQLLLSVNNGWLEANHNNFEVSSRVKWVLFHPTHGWTAEVPIKSQLVTSSEFCVTITPHDGHLTLSVFHQTHDQGVLHSSTLVFWKPDDGLVRLISAYQVGTHGLWVAGSLQAAYIAWKTYYGYETAPMHLRVTYRVKVQEDVNAQEWMV